MPTKKRKEYLRKKWSSAPIDLIKAYQPNRILNLMRQKQEKSTVSSLESQLSDLDLYVKTNHCETYYDYETHSDYWIGDYETINSGYYVPEDTKNIDERYNQYYDFKYNLPDNQQGDYVLTGQSVTYGKQYAKVYKGRYYIISNTGIHYHGTRVYWYGDINQVYPCLPKGLSKHNRQLAISQFITSQYEEYKSDRYSYFLELNLFDYEDNLIECLSCFGYETFGLSSKYETAMENEAKIEFLPDLIKKYSSNEKD